MQILPLTNGLAHSGMSLSDRRRVIENEHAYFDQFAALGFDSAKQTRLHSTYQRIVGSADSVLDIDRERLVSFSRQLYDNSVPFRAFTERFIDLVIGTGLNPIGKNPTAKRAVSQFVAWANRKSNCDIAGKLNFWQMQRQVMREIMVAGDSTAVKTSTGKLQLIEAEQIRDPYGQKLSDGSVVNLEMVHDGVEVDAHGRIVRVWFSEYGKWGGNLDYRVRPIESEYVMFCAYRTRSSQTRGVPLWAPALERFAMYEDYLTATGVAANLAARLALIIKTMQGASEKNLSAAMGGSSSRSRSSASPGEANLLALDTGSIFHLKPGEDVSTVQGAQPTAAFESYSRAILGMMAAMAGAPIEVIMLDNTRVNYTTARMAEYQARNGAQPFREVVVSDYLDPTYEWWRARAILSGRLDDDPEHGSDFIEWRPPTRWSIDPGREYDAEHKAVLYNFKTREQVIREMDQEDPDAIILGRAAEIKRDRELGIAPPLLPGQEQPGGNAAAQETDDDESLIERIVARGVSRERAEQLLRSD